MVVKGVCGSRSATRPSLWGSVLPPAPSPPLSAQWEKRLPVSLGSLKERAFFPGKVYSAARGGSPSSSPKSHLSKKGAARLLRQPPRPVAAGSVQAFPSDLVGPKRPKGSGEKGSWLLGVRRSGGRGDNALLATAKAGGGRLNSPAGGGRGGGVWRPLGAQEKRRIKRELPSLLVGRRLVLRSRRRRIPRPFSRMAGTGPRHF